jgi:hypothetical protein
LTVVEEMSVVDKLAFVFSSSRALLSRVFKKVRFLEKRLPQLAGRWRPIDRSSHPSAREAGAEGSQETRNISTISIRSLRIEVPPIGAGGKIEKNAVSENFWRTAISPQKGCNLPLTVAEVHAAMERERRKYFYDKL